MKDMTRSWQSKRVRRMEKQVSESRAMAARWGVFVRNTPVYEAK